MNSKKKEKKKKPLHQGVLKLCEGKTMMCYSGPSGVVPETCVQRNHLEHSFDDKCYSTVPFFESKEPRTKYITNFKCFKTSWSVGRKRPCSGDTQPEPAPVKGKKCPCPCSQPEEDPCKEKDRR